MHGYAIAQFIQRASDDVLQRRGGRAVSGAAPARGARLAAVDVGHVGEQPPREVLPAERARPPRARARSRLLAPRRVGRHARHAERLMKMRVDDLIGVWHRLVGALPAGAAATATSTTSWRFISRCARPSTSAAGLPPTPARLAAAVSSATSPSSRSRRATCGRFRRSRASGAGRPLRAAHALIKTPGFSRRRRAGARDRHRRQHGDLQPRGRDAAARPAVSGRRSAGGADRQRAARGASSGAATPIRITRTGGRKADALRGHGGVRARPR